MSDQPIISSDFSLYRENTELCSIEIPVGACSQNRQMVFGYDGYVFVFEGENNVSGQYLKSTADVETLAQAWIDLITRRRARAAAANAQFVQIVIPEKSSLLPEKAPFPAAHGTPLMLKISEGLAGCDDYIDARTLFEGETALTAFPKADFHMSPIGSATIFCAALERLGLEVPTITFGPPQIWKGDLYDYFGGLQLYNRMAFPSSPEISGYEQGVVQTLEFDGNGHRGARRVWSNSTAPIKKRVLAFGNSFFERGGSPACLSWWFARWFQDFDFHWTSRMEDEDIEAFKPDIIICQTIERFLIEVPPL